MAREPQPPARSRRRGYVAAVPAVAALAGVLLLGTLGFAWTEGWDLGRALYFTVITITTVGYGDEGLSEPGRGFAVLLLLGGIGAATHAFATLVEAAIHRPPLWRRRMESRIGQLENHVIVCGYGRMGETVCEHLAASGQELVVIESHPEAAARAHRQGKLVVEGSATEDEVLVHAGIGRAWSLVSAVDSDVENLAITLSARDLRPEMPIVARAERDDEVRKLRRAGATRTVSPFRSGGVDVVNALLRPRVAEFIAASAHARSEVALAEIPIEEGCELAGVTLADYGRGEGAGISFVALERPGKQIILPPSGGQELVPGDLLIVAGAADSVRAMRERGRARG